MSETLAVFGGSFDPPHVGHALVVAWAKATGAVNRVLVIPAFAHAFGKQSVAFEHRFAMCQLAFADFPFAEVSDIERTLGESRSLHTIRALQKQHPDGSFRLLIGSDILAGAHRWHRWDDVVAMAPPLVIGRSGHPHESAPDALILPALSSTDLRQRISSAQSTEGRISAKVKAYIEQHELYR